MGFRAVYNKSTGTWVAGGGGSSSGGSSGGSGGGGGSSQPKKTTQTFYVDPSGKKWTSKQAAEARGGVARTETSTYSGGTKIGTTAKTGGSSVWKSVGTTSTGTPVYERNVGGVTERIATTSLTGSTKGIKQQPKKTVLTGAKTQAEQKMSFTPKDEFAELEKPKEMKKYITDKSTGKPITYTSQGKKYYKTIKGETIDTQTGQSIDLTRPQVIEQKTPLFGGLKQEEAPIFRPEDFEQKQSFLEPIKSYTPQEIKQKNNELNILSKRIAEFNKRANDTQAKSFLETDVDELKRLSNEREKLSALIKSQSPKTQPNTVLTKLESKASFGSGGSVDVDVIKTGIATDLNLPSEEVPIEEKIGWKEKARIIASTPGSPLNVVQGLFETKEQKMERFEKDIEAVQETEEKLGKFLKSQEESFGMIPGLGLEKKSTVWQDETGKIYDTKEEAEKNVPKEIIYKTSAGEEFKSLSDARIVDPTGDIEKIEKTGGITEIERPATWKDWLTKEQWSTLGRKTLTTVGPGIVVGLPTMAGLAVKKLELTGRGLMMDETRSSVLEESGRAAKETPITVAKSFDPRTPEGVINIGLTALAIKSMGGARAQVRATTPKAGTTPKTTNVLEISKGKSKTIVEQGKFINKRGETVNFETRTTIPKSGGKGTYEIKLTDTAGKIISKQSGKINHEIKVKEAGSGEGKLSYESKTTLDPGISKRKIVDVKKGDVVVTKKPIIEQPMDFKGLKIDKGLPTKKQATTKIKEPRIEIENYIGKTQKTFGRPKYENIQKITKQTPVEGTTITKGKVAGYKSTQASPQQIAQIESILSKQRMIARQQSVAKAKNIASRAKTKTVDVAKQMYPEKLIRSKRGELSTQRSGADPFDFRGTGRGTPKTPEVSTAPIEGKWSYTLKSPTEGITIQPKPGGGFRYVKPKSPYDLRVVKKPEGGLKLIEPKVTESVLQQWKQSKTKSPILEKPSQSIVKPKISKTPEVSTAPIEGRWSYTLKSPNEGMTIEPKPGGGFRYVKPKSPYDLRVVQKPDGGIKLVEPKVTESVLQQYKASQLQAIAKQRQQAVRGISDKYISRGDTLTRPGTGDPFDFRGIGRGTGGTGRWKPIVQKITETKIPAGIGRTNLANVPGMGQLGLKVQVTPWVTPTNIPIVPPNYGTQELYLGRYGPKSEILSNYLGKTVSEPEPGIGTTPDYISDPISDVPPSGDTYVDATTYGDTVNSGDNYVENIIYGDTISPGIGLASVLGIKGGLPLPGAGGGLPRGWGAGRGGRGVKTWVIANPIKNLQEEWRQQQRTKSKLGITTMDSKKIKKFI